MLSILKYLTLVILFYVVGVFFYAAYFAFPQTDDFCALGRVDSVTRNPLFDTYYMYLNWSGRYASMFLIALPAWIMLTSPIEVNTTYQVFIFIYIASFLGSLYYYFAVLGLDRLTNGLLTLLVSGLVLLILPSKVEGLYWLTGSAVYFIPVSAFLMLASALHLDYLKGSDQNLPSLSSALLLVAVVGFNELIAITAGILIGLHFLLQPSGQRNNKKNALLVLIFICSLLVAVLAPGNFVRNQTISIPRHQIGVSFALMFKSISKLWKYNVSLHKTVVFFAMAGGVLLGGLPSKKPIFNDWRLFLALPIAIFISIPIHLIVYSFLTGEITPGRTLNQCTELLWIGILLLIVFLSSRVTNFFSHPKFYRTKVYEVVVGLGLFIVSLSYMEHKEFKHLKQTLKVFAPQWAAEQSMRKQEIDLALVHGNKYVEVAALSEEQFRPPFLKGADITEDPKHWINYCVASYYHLDQIKIEAKELR